jgi:hypothetical protein
MDKTTDTHDDVAYSADFLQMLVDMAAASERELLPMAQKGLNVEGWVVRLIKRHDVVYAVWDDPKLPAGHDAWIVSGGWDLLASDVDWNPKVAAFRVDSKQAAEMAAAHHGDFRDDPDVTCPRLTHIVLLNGGDRLNVVVMGNQAPMPLHRPRLDGVVQKAGERLEARFNRREPRNR